MSAPGECAVYVTFFPTYSASSKRAERLTLTELAARIRTISADAKERLPWLKLACFGDQRTAASSLRNNGNVVAITGVEADYDGERISLDCVEQLMRGAGISCLIYTSPSHSEDTPRWRVLCPLSTEHPPEDRDRFMGRLNGVLGGVASRESWTLSQSYYYGAVRRNPSHRVTVIDGQCIDLADRLDAGAIGRPAEPARDAPPAPASRPEQITDTRLRGLFISLLANISAAPAGQRHFAVWRNGKTLGGHLHHAACPWGEAEAIEQLVGALPPSDQDLGARRTAADAVRAGAQTPLDLEERPRDAPAHAGRQDRAAELWNDAAPLPGTLGAVWLEALGLRHLTDCPELRFCAVCPHPTGARLPAMVAAVRAADGTLTGILRTYLRADGSGGADIAPPRAALGQIQGGAIHLAPIEHVATVQELVVAVDFEEAASLGALMNRPAWAAGTVQNLSGRDGMTLPPSVRRVVVIATSGDGAARSAWHRFRREGRAVTVATPPDDAASYVELAKNKSGGRVAA